MYIVIARVTPLPEVTTFYIETDDIANVSSYIQRKTGQWHQVLSAQLVEGVCIEESN
jgi:hypothetical protein